MSQDLRPTDVVRLEPDGVHMLDQRKLPDEVSELVCTNAAEVADAIATLAIRGAPAIGVAAAMGLALAAINEGGALAALGTPIALLTRRARRFTAVSCCWFAAIAR